MIFLYLLVALIQDILAENYTLALLPTQRGALCLDGSPAGLYYHQGVGANKNKFMIYFDSGGFCGGATVSDTLQSCYKRSFGSLGSTVNYKVSTNKDSDGLLSTLPEVNPVFYDWTKIFMIYCDGTQYLSNKSEPTLYKQRNLYFRGKNNVMEQFKYMSDRFDFYNKDTIVITGVSAGSLATYFWVNYVKEHTITSKVVGIPDSGIFFVDYESPIYKQQFLKIRGNNLLKVAEIEQFEPHPQCQKKYPEDPLMCLSAINIVDYINVPLFIVNSPYDSFSLENSIGLRCLGNKPPYSLDNCNQTEIDAIKDYRKLSLDSFMQMKGNRTDRGFWSPACVQHGFSDAICFHNDLYRVPTTSGIMLSEAIREFLQSPNNAKIYIDSVQWPLNKGCNGRVNFGFNLLTQA